MPPLLFNTQSGRVDLPRLDHPTIVPLAPLADEGVLLTTATGDAQKKCVLIMQVDSHLHEQRR